MTVFAIFKAAINQDYLTDKNLCKIYLPKLKIVICRPLRFVRFKNYQSVLNILLFIAMPLWFVFFPVLFFLQWLAVLFKMNKYRLQRSKVNFPSKRILVALSHGATSIVRKVREEHKPDAVFVVPWCKMKDQAYFQENKELNIIHIFAALNFFDTFKALYYAIINSYRYIINKGVFNGALQVFPAYKFMLVYLALAKICNKNIDLIYVNHYDRWSILFDQMPNIGKRIYMQHGCMRDEDRGFYLYNLDVLYYFDNKSKDVILHKVSKAQKQVKCYPLEHKLQVREMSGLMKGKKSILFVGTIVNPDFECKIILELAKINKFNLILKPHPIYGLNAYKKIADKIHVITDNNFFPKVDLVVCNESSLGIEYEAVGISVLWLHGDDLSNTLKEIFSSLECLT